MYAHNRTFLFACECIFVRVQFYLIYFSVRPLHSTSNTGLANPFCTSAFVAVVLVLILTRLAVVCHACLSKFFILHLMSFFHAAIHLGFPKDCWKSKRPSKYIKVNGLYF